MSKLSSAAGYAAATLTIVASVASPFVLFGLFTRAVAAAGVHIDPIYTGGEVVRRTSTGRGYSIQVHAAVPERTPLQTAGPFVQIDWLPISALPAHVDDTVDLDGDGLPDLRASFDVPGDPRTPLSVEVEPLCDKVTAMHAVSRDALGSLIVRLPDRVVVRVPLAHGR